MNQMCLVNFLEKSSPSHVERHSDSSDFENLCNIPIERHTNGNHCFLKIKTHKKRKSCVHTQRLCDNVHLLCGNRPCNRDLTEMYTRRQVLRDKCVACTITNATQRCDSRSRLSVRNKNVTSPTMLRNPDRSSKIHSNMEKNNCDNSKNFAYLDSRTARKFSKTHEFNKVQPIYTFAKSITEFPFRRINDCIELSQFNVIERNYSDHSFDIDYSLSSESDDAKSYKNKEIFKYIMKKLEHRMKRKNASSVETMKSEKQQYPSKLDLKSPCQTFDSTSCQTKSLTHLTDEHTIVPSKSSELWDFLLQNMNYQIPHRPEISKFEVKNINTNCNKGFCHIKSGTTKAKTLPRDSQKPEKQKSSNHCDKIEHISRQIFPDMGPKISDSKYPKKENILHDDTKPYHDYTDIRTGISEADPKYPKKENILHDDTKPYHDYTGMRTEILEADSKCPKKENKLQADTKPYHDYTDMKTEISEADSKCPKKEYKFPDDTKPYHDYSDMKTEISDLKPDSKCPKKKKITQDDTEYCQEPHDFLVQQMREKYKGEILCIHNPPCILINGSLYVPKPSTSQEQQCYPGTQSKIFSFVQMCRKMKRAKTKNIDQAIQYHPPSIKSQERIVPVYRSEKTIQSVCNHSPPCEIVPGCHKAVLSPVLPSSCIHVPMCPKFPQCFFDVKNIDEVGEEGCVHTPKCRELPLCTRKYVMFIERENATTQVKAKIKVRCRHQPRCLLIPKCLTEANTEDWYPECIIPGCVHQPSCDLVPVCCRRRIEEESVSLEPQTITSCPIV